MPKKGYKKTKEHIEKQVISRKKNGWWKNSEETKKKQRKSMIGRKQKKEHIKKRVKQLKGQTRTKEQKEKFGNRGEKNPNWQGGKSYEPYSIDWTETLKRAIRERDNYICQFCNQYGNIVHHKDKNKLNCNPENLIIVCIKCHNKIHKFVKI